MAEKAVNKEAEAEVGAAADKYQMAFKYFDKENRGSITVDQLAAVVLSSGVRISAAELEDIGKEMGAGPDGSIGYEGFVAALQRQEAECGAVQGMDHLNSMFEAMQRDADGDLQVPDWQTALTDLELSIAAEDAADIPLDEDTTEEDDDAALEMAALEGETAALVAEHSTRLLQPPDEGRREVGDEEA